MAFSDADGYFFMIETGHAGRNGYGGIYGASRIVRWPERDSLNLPNPRTIGPNGPDELFFLFHIILQSTKYYLGKKIKIE